MATDIIARGMITEYKSGTNISFKENEDGSVTISASGDVSSEDTVARDTIDNHKLNKNNPHNVTAEQVGLGNVDNTADLDKPISTAVQTALNDKVDKSDVQDNLESTDTTSPLSANQGRILNEKITEHTNNSDIHVTTTVKNKIYTGFVNVLDYGADETGIKDSSEAFNSAIVECNKESKSLYIPSGKYIIEKDLISINSGLSLIGEHDSQHEEITGTFIHDKRLKNSPLFTFSGKGAGGSVKNITFWCFNEDYQYNTTCIYTDRIGWDFRIENCTFAHFDCALNLNGNDTFIKAVKIMFCGIHNYAFELNTNGSFIYDLHMEHCRHMVHTPSIYNFANHFIGCKFEMSTFKLGIDSQSPMLFEGYDKYGLVNFANCNFYNLDFIAYISEGIEFKNIPYMMNFSTAPSVLSTTKYCVARFTDCLFNIGRGSGAYTFPELSYSVKYIFSNKPIDITHCTFHNLSGDFPWSNSVEINGSYSKMCDNEMYFSFEDYRSDQTYGSYCQTTKQLPYIYNCDFEGNRIYYSDELFGVNTAEVPDNNTFINANNQRMELLTVGENKIFSSNPSGWIKLFEVSGYVSGTSVYIDFDVIDYYNGMSGKFVFNCCSNKNSPNKFDTSNWIFVNYGLKNHSFDNRVVAVINNDKIAIYFNPVYDSKVVDNTRLKLHVNNYCSLMKIEKANRIVYETPDLTKPYIYATISD